MNSISDLQNYCLSKGIPFASYREPGEATRIIISHPVKIYNSLDLLDLKDADGFLMHPFQLSQDTPAYYFPREFECDENHVHLAQPSRISHHESNRFYQDGELYSTDFESYQSQFESLKANLEKGETEKIVLSRRKVLDALHPASYSMLFESLCEEYPSAFVSWVSIPGQSGWIGASPEILLKQSGSECKTVALAGTIPAEQPGRQFTSKEEHEQEFVIREIVARITAFTGEIRQDERKVVKAGSVSHLKTTFNFNITQASFLPLALSLHPTSAVAGIPQDRAIRLIQQIENQPRKYYSGFLGHLSSTERSSLYVNLRCMEILANQICLYTGGGLTTESELHSEWQETEDKAETLLAVIEKIKKFAAN